MDTLDKDINAILNNSGSDPDAFVDQILRKYPCDPIILHELVKFVMENNETSELIKSWEAADYQMVDESEDDIKEKYKILANNIKNENSG